MGYVFFAILGIVLGIILIMYYNTKEAVLESETNRKNYIKYVHDLCENFGAAPILIFQDFKGGNTFSGFQKIHENDVYIQNSGNYMIKTGNTFTHSNSNKDLIVINDNYEVLHANNYMGLHINVYFDMLDDCIDLFSEQEKSNIISKIKREVNDKVKSILRDKDYYSETYKKQLEQQIKKEMKVDKFKKLYPEEFI